MKYSYTFVFVVLVFHQLLLIVATNETQHTAEEHLNARKTNQLSRNKRQAFKAGSSPYLKRNDNYEGDEVDEQENNGNQKKSKSFFKPWGGKRSDTGSLSSINKQQNIPQHNLNSYLVSTADNLPLAIKRVKTEKTFRSWGGKRSGAMNYNLENELNAKMLNEYLKRLEALNMLANELDSQNYE